MPGIKNIYRMTAPLGYDNGGDFDLAAIMADMKASRGPAEVTHPIQKIISDRIPVSPYSVSQKERAKELGKKGLESLKGLGSKSIDVLRQLLGSKSAEAGVYIPDETLDAMTIDEVVREIELLGKPGFGMGVRPNYIQHLRDLADALEKKIEE